MNLEQVANSKSGATNRHIEICARDHSGNAGKSNRTNATVLLPAVKSCARKDGIGSEVDRSRIGFAAQRSVGAVTVGGCDHLRPHGGRRGKRRQQRSRRDQGSNWLRLNGLQERVLTL